MPRMSATKPRITSDHQFSASTNVIAFLPFSCFDLPRSVIARRPWPALSEKYFVRRDSRAAASGREPDFASAARISAMDRTA